MTLIRQGEGPAAAYLRQHNERIAERHRLEQLIAVIIDDPSPTGATAGGDERKLRGIPAIARGVSGEIPGSRPDRIR